MNPADIVRSYEPLMRSDHDARLLEKIAKEIEQRQGAAGLRDRIRDALAADDPKNYRNIWYPVGFPVQGLSPESIDRCADIAAATVAHSPDVARVKEAFHMFQSQLATTGIQLIGCSTEFRLLAESVASLSASAAGAGDSARIDWLESHNTTWWWQCRVVGDLTPEVTLRSNAGEGFKTAREAIDAAMSAEGEHNG